MKALKYFILILFLFSFFVADAQHVKLRDLEPAVGSNYIPVTLPNGRQAYVSKASILDEVLKKRLDNTSLFATTTTIEGEFYITEGFTSGGDGGGGTYIIEASGTADNMRIFATNNGKYARLIPNEDGSITPLQLGAILDDATDDRANIQAALTNFDWVKCHAIGKLLISDSLIVKANQFIDFGRGLEIESNSTTNHLMLTVNGSFTSGISRTANIHVSGGIWDYNDAIKVSGGGNTTDTYCFLFHKVDNILVENLEILDVTKFGISCADFRGATFRGIDFNTISDGIHAMGPGFNLNINNITGVTGDDFIAVSGSDFTANAYTEGDITNITIRDIFPDSSGTQGNIISMFPGNSGTGLSTDPNFRFRNVSIDNVKGYSTNASVIHVVQYGAEGSGTTGKTQNGVIENLKISNISGKGSYLVHFDIDSLKSVVVDGIFPSDSTGKILTSCYIDRLVMSNLDFQGNNLSPIVNFNNSSNVRDVVIEKMKAQLSSSGTRFIQFESDSTGHRATLRDCRLYKTLYLGAGDVYINTDTFDLSVNNCYFDNMAYAIKANSKAVKITLNDTYFHNVYRAVNDETSNAEIEVHPNSYIYDNDTYGNQYAFDEITAGAITLVHPSNNIGGYISSAVNYTIPATYPSGAFLYIYNSSSSSISIGASGGTINSTAAVWLGGYSGGWFKKTTSANWNYSASNSIGQGTTGYTLRSDGSSWIANSIIYNNGTNVGIGTTTPLSQKLNVNGYTATTGLTKYSTGEYLIDSDASVGNLFKGWTALGSANRLDIGASSTFKTWWRSTGNIGIGTSAPTERLELDGSVYVNVDDGGVIVDASGNKRFGLFKPAGASPQIRFGNTLYLDIGYVNQASVTGGTFTSAMRITNVGLIGLGIAPASKLHVYESNTSVDATTGLTIEKTGTGDAVTQYLLTGGQRWVTGIDNSDSDKFKIAHSADLNTNADLTITTAGDITMSNNVVVSKTLASTMNSTTLGAAATTLAITSNVLKLTGDGGGNTLATITGGVSGQILTIIFVDALVTITDTAAATANTVNLSAAFTSTADDVIQLIFDGNKWFEISRSVN
jgi:hypothetical protein